LAASVWGVGAVVFSAVVIEQKRKISKQGNARI